MTEQTNPSQGTQIQLDKDYAIKGAVVVAILDDLKNTLPYAQGAVINRIENTFAATLAEINISAEPEKSNPPTVEGLQEGGVQ